MIYLESIIELDSGNNKQTLLTILTSRSILVQNLKILFIFFCSNYNPHFCNFYQFNNVITEAEGKLVPHNHL